MGQFTMKFSLNLRFSQKYLNFFCNVYPPSLKYLSLPVSTLEKYNLCQLALFKLTNIDSSLYKTNT